ncbi:MAG: EAL domain-containing protein [Candidatus Nanopelagicales bacterium]
MSLRGVAADNPPAPAAVRRRDRWLLGFSGALGVVAVMVDALSRHEGRDPLPLTRLLAAGFAMLAAALLVSAMLDRARRDAVRRRPVLALALAGGLLFGGMALGYLLTATEPGPFDSRVESVPLLVMLPFAAYALLATCLPRGMSRQELRIAIVDSAVGVLALGIVWWEAVVPYWVDDLRFGFWVHLNRVLIFAGLALTVVIAVVSRRIGSLPFVQLVLLVGGLAAYFVSDVLGQVVPGADDVTSVTYSIPGYVLALTCLMAFAHRPPVEVESARYYRARVLLATGTPLVLALGAGAIVISAAAVSLDAVSAPAALLAWALLLVGVLVVRLSSAMELRRAQDEAVAAVLADRTREGWFRALVGDSTDGVLVLDAHGTVVYTSPRVDAAFDFGRPAGSPREFSDLLVERSAAEVRLLLAQVTLDPARSGPYDLLLRGADVHPVEVEATVRPIVDIEFEGFVVTLRDVSDTRRLQRQLANSRRRDELTGLLSREALLAELSGALDDDGDAELAQVAVAVLDLERFGRLNDGLGHEVGDEILVAVARTFEQLPEEVRSVARVGADSFALLVVADAPVPPIADAVDLCRDALRGLLLSDGREVELTFRAGYAVADPAEARSAEWLLEAADLALARSKSSRNALMVAYSEQMRQETEQRIVAERVLRRALAAGRIEPFFQPVVRLSDGRCIGGEALARLRHEDGTLGMPADFIPLAEELGLIGELGTSILRRAVERTAELSASLGRPTNVSVNVSVDQLVPDFVPLVRDLVAEHGLAPAQLTLEVTESMLAERGSQIPSVLRDLRALGITVSLDDFGTGYSSMSYLATLPVDVLKIDRSFVSTLGSSTEGLTLARMVVQLAGSLDLSTVAEGIETIEQADLLRGMGCDYGQGYLFARPLPYAEFADYVRGPVADLAPATP